MLKPTTFYDLASGRQQGWAPELARQGLALTAMGYGWAVKRRNRQYDSGHRKSLAVWVPVIGVGNITLGGTGKTPFVRWLAEELLSLGMRPAIVSRGYASRNDINDEAQELAAAIPQVPHVQNRDRVAAAWLAIARHQADCILLDDGFQHRRLRRDLDIVLLDALMPFGFDRLFPRGTLREPVESLSRARVVVLSRANLIDAEQRESIRTRVAKLAPQALYVEAVQQPVGLVSLAELGQCGVHHGGAEVNSLGDRRVFAFCGIGNPQGFRRTVEEWGGRLVGFREFPDHHHYTNAELFDIVQSAEAGRADLLLCTTKDLVKVPRDLPGGENCRALAIETCLTTGGEALRELLRRRYAQTAQVA